MKMFSTYYDKTQKLDKSKYTFVRVSRAEPPKWFVEEFEYVDLSDTFGPTPAMLEECHPAKNWEAFLPRYKNEILSALNKTAILELIETISMEHGNRPLLFVCFEALPENCHRHLIGDFLGISVEEI